MAEFPIIFELEPYIGTDYATATSTWTYSTLCAGWENVAEALNETVQQYHFLCGNGHAMNKVTGMAVAVTLTGRRVQGDTAQDYIFGKKYEVGSQRESSFKLVMHNKSSGSDVVTTLVVPCTIANIQEINGGAVDNWQISCEIRFNGKPTITTGT